MQYDSVVVHYHEIGLKGKNRDQFENGLASNIRRALTGTGYLKVRRLPGRLVVTIPPDAEPKPILDALGNVFGISNFAPSIETETTMDAMSKTALALADSTTFDSFQVRARKGHSSFPSSSQTINEVVGQAIKDSTGKRVDLSSGEWTCHIELVLDRAWIYWDRHVGPGGLPVGVSGKVLALFSGGIDSPVAAWEIAKRGANVDLVHFHGRPYTDPSSIRQVRRLTESLTPWLGDVRLWLVPFGEIQSDIVTTAPQELRVVLYRRFMMRIAEALAAREGAEALVTGESLGQVASQTLTNIVAIDSVVRSMPVLRPLIGRDKLEIERLAKRIGTYETSIDPHQDCCVLFVPRQVTTKASADELAKAEAALDVGDLVRRGIDGAEASGG